MEKSISKMVNKLFLSIQAMSRTGLEEFSITPSQIRILLFIGNRNSIGEKTFQKDIEREFNIRGSSVTSALNNLERNNWIRREYVEYDARLKSIVFAEKTYAVIDYIEKMSDRFEVCMKDTLSDEEFAVFCRCMDKMVTALEKNKEEFFGKTLKELSEISQK